MSRSTARWGPPAARCRWPCSPPPPGARRETSVLDFATEADRLAILGRELFWLPQGGISQSDLDLRAIEKILGRMTIRTKRTLERIAAKFLS